MKIYLPGENAPKEKIALALGNFDGVHKAHSALIERAVKAKGLSAIFTFKDVKTPYLTTLEERLELLEAMGADVVFLYDFERLRNMPYTDFFNEILVEKIGISSAFCGFNYTFGNRALGKAADLKRLCALRGIDCEILDEMKCAGTTVSSSAIKLALENGDVDLAFSMLGRHYSVRGRVVHGKALASKLGFPTMNIEYDTRRAPLKHGVYYTECEIDNNVYPAVSNFGIRPTFNDKTPTVETYILNEKGDFYSKEINVRFLAFARDEQKFADEKELSEVVTRDIEKAKLYFGL